jgi:chaperonin cofactor prefoldin
MYKSTAGSAQSRTVRAALHSTENRNGVDSTVWKDARDEIEDRIGRAKQAKVEVTKRLARIKADISQGLNERQLTGRRVNPHVWSKMLTEKAQLTHRIQEIEGELIAAKRAREEAERARPEKPINFQSAFVVMAKEMLAEPVYQRIRLAALHRMGEAE